MGEIPVSDPETQRLREILESYGVSAPENASLNQLQAFKNEITSQVIFNRGGLTKEFIELTQASIFGNQEV